ncbi:GNAT family N-acetyltransferase, partial [Streptomyces sp. NPDC001675]
CRQPAVEVGYAEGAGVARAAEPVVRPDPTGLGSRLLARAEHLARTDRACANARLETWDFQAPDFYKKQGYDVVCVIPDYPPGLTEYTLTKRLG